MVGMLSRMSTKDLARLKDMMESGAL